MQDIEGALDELNARLTVTFSASVKQPRLDVPPHASSPSSPLSLLLPLPPPAVTSQLPDACSAALPSAQLRLRAVLFSTGVNVLQSLGFLHAPPPPPGSRGRRARLPAKQVTATSVPVRF